MCVQIDFVWECGHRAFDRFINCANFGTSCLGNTGKHRDNMVAGECKDCKMRELIQNQPGYRKDPWGADDPFKGKRKP